MDPSSVPSPIFLLCKLQFMSLYSLFPYYFAFWNNADNRPFPLLFDVDSSQSHSQPCILYVWRFCFCRTENMHWINANIHHPSLAYELWCIFLGLYTIYIFPFRLCIYEFAIAIARQPKTVVVRALSSVCRGHLHLHPNTTTHYSIWYMFSQGKRRS